MCWGFWKWKRYKNSKRQNFLLELTLVLNRWTKNLEALRFICFFKNIIEKLVLMRSRYKKFKEAEFLTRTDKFCCWSFRYKNSKRPNFFTRSDWFCCALSLRVYLLFCKYNREVFLIRSRYKKFKEAEFFTRTDKFCCWSSRYKKFKEAKFFYSKWHEF